MSFFLGDQRHVRLPGIFGPGNVDMFTKAAQALEQCNVFHRHRFAAEQVVPLDPLDGIGSLGRGKMSQSDCGLEAPFCGKTSGATEGALDLGLERIQLRCALDADQKAVRIEAFADVGLCEGQLEGFPGKAGEGEIDLLHPVPVRHLSDETEGDVMVLGRNPLHAGHGTAHQRQRFPDIGRKVECDKKSQVARFP